MTPLDKYLYANDSFIISGALLALGIVNCRVTNDCDPAQALLGDYASSSDDVLRIGAMLGLGIAYAGIICFKLVEKLKRFIKLQFLMSFLPKD